MNEWTLDETIQMGVATGDCNEGEARVRWARDQLFSRNLLWCLRALERERSPELKRSRRTPYSRVLHGRVARACNLRDLIAAKLPLAECHRILCALDQIEKFCRSEGECHSNILAAMRSDPSPKAYVILGMKLLEPNAEPFYQAKGKRRRK